MRMMAGLAEAPDQHALYTGKMVLSREGVAVLNKNGRRGVVRIVEGSVIVGEMVSNAFLGRGSRKHGKMVSEASPAIKDVMKLFLQVFNDEERSLTDDGIGAVGHLKVSFRVLRALFSTGTIEQGDILDWLRFRYALKLRAIAFALIEPFSRAMYQTLDVYVKKMKEAKKSGNINTDAWRNYDRIQTLYQGYAGPVIAENFNASLDIMYGLLPELLEIYQRDIGSLDQMPQDLDKIERATIDFFERVAKGQKEGAILKRFRERLVSPNTLSCFDARTFCLERRGDGSFFLKIRDDIMNIEIPDEQWPLNGACPAIKEKGPDGVTSLVREHTSKVFGLFRQHYFPYAAPLYSNWRERYERLRSSWEEKVPV